MINILYICYYYKIKAIFYNTHNITVLQYIYLVKKTNEQTLKEVIKDLLDVYKLNTKLNETKLINSWEHVVGKMISKHTVDLHINKKVMYIKLDSAALRNELIYEKQKLINILNKEVGEKVIKDIVLK